MTKMTVQEMRERTKALDNKFPHKFSEQDRFMDLIEEIGELSQSLQITEKRKLTDDPKKQKTVEDVADAFCDVLYDLFLLAEGRGLDIEKEYKDMLERLEARVDKGEFDEK